MVFIVLLVGLALAIEEFLVFLVNGRKLIGSPRSAWGRFANLDGML